MSGEKLVLRDDEERAFWRMAHMAHAACWAGGVEGVYGTCEDVADAAVRAYRERCGTPEPVADDAHLARCWRDLVDTLPKDAFADMDTDEHPVDAIVRNFKRLLSRCTPPASKGCQTEDDCDSPAWCAGKPTCRKWDAASKDATNG